MAALGCALQAGAVSMAMLIVGRFVAGVAVGMLTSTIPMYAGEISEPKYRGVLSGLLQWFLSWGFLVAQWLGYGCSFVDNQFQCQSSPSALRRRGHGLTHAQGAFHLLSSAFRRSSSCPASGSSRNPRAG